MLKAERLRYSNLRFSVVIFCFERRGRTCTIMKTWLQAGTGGSYDILTSAALSSLSNGSPPSFTYGRASDALTFASFEDTPPRPSSLPSNTLMPAAVSLWDFYALCATHFCRTALRFEICSQPDFRIRRKHHGCNQRCTDSAGCDPTASVLYLRQ